MTTHCHVAYFLHLRGLCFPGASVDTDHSAKWPAGEEEGGVAEVIRVVSALGVKAAWRGRWRIMVDSWAGCEGRLGFMEKGEGSTILLSVPGFVFPLRMTEFHAPVHFSISRHLAEVSTLA